MLSFAKATQETVACLANPEQINDTSITVQCTTTVRMQYLTLRKGIKLHCQKHAIPHLLSKSVKFQEHSFLGQCLMMKVSNVRSSYRAQSSCMGNLYIRINIVQNIGYTVENDYETRTEVSHADSVVEDNGDTISAYYCMLQESDLKCRWQPGTTWKYR